MNKRALQEGYVYDYATSKEVDIRKPEEGVRQDYEKVLCNDYGYEKKQIDIEVPIQRGAQRREKADIVIYKTGNVKKRDQTKDILGIVETKRESRTDGIEQLESYMTATCCRWGVWTNGNEIEYLYREVDTGEVRRNVIFQIPRKDESLDELGKVSKQFLKPASNLKLIFKRILNTLYTNTNISRKEKLGNEMIRLLFCKLQDELFEPNEIPRFRAEIAYQDNNFDDARDRIHTLFDEVKEDLVSEGVFEDSEKITLDDKSLAYVIGELQMYSLMRTDEDVVGSAFEVFAESKLVGEKGEFFTPRQVVKLAVELVDPRPNQTIFDPACGSGGFLIYALEYVWKKMREDKKWRDLSDQRFAKEKEKLAKKTIYGIDKEIDLVKITKAYMAIIGDGKSRIAQQNSLHEAEDFDGRAKEFFVKRSNKRSKEFIQFDIILTNPPFGSKDTKVLESESKNYDLGYTWKKTENGRYEKTDKVKQTPAQELFIERCLNMLKPNGLMAIVLPETYFHAPTKKHIVQYIKDRASIKAVIDLPHNSFRPHCNAKTLLVVLEKGRPQGDIIFGVAEEIGKDHLGKEKKRPDSEGYLTDEIWDDSKYIMKELKLLNRKNRKKYVFTLPKKRIKNDIYVPRYYWNVNVKDIEKQAQKINCHLVSMNTLCESEIISVFRGHGSPKNEYKGLGDVPYVRAGDIGNWAIYKNPVAFIPLHVYKDVKGVGVDLQKGDLIFVKEGSYRVGDVAYVLSRDTEILLNSHCLVFKVNRRDNEWGIDSYYLLYLLSHELTKKQLYNKVFLDTTLPNIGDRWKELLLPISKDPGVRNSVKNQMKHIFNLREKSESYIANITYDK